MIHGDKNVLRSLTALSSQTDLAGAKGNSEGHGWSAGALYYPEGIGTESKGL